MGSTTGGRFESFRFVDAGRPTLFFTVYYEYAVYTVCISDLGNFGAYGVKGSARGSSF